MNVRLKKRGEVVVNGVESLQVVVDLTLPEKLFMGYLCFCIGMKSLKFY